MELKTNEFLFCRILIVQENLTSSHWVAQKNRPMRDLVWLIIVLLIIGWLIGYFAFPDLGSIIHILIVIAVILIIYKLLTGRSL